MPRTTQCPNCGVVLTLPEEAYGRRLKCPKCSFKFQSGTPESKPPSSAPGVAEAGPASGSGPVRATRVPSDDDLPLPTAEKDLRETFDLPLLMDDDAPRAAPARARGAASDAAALFQDDAPALRRPKGAAARANARRCSCGGVVPAGMSLCARCGTDLDTGRREIVDELLDEPPPAPAAAGPPMGVIIVGGVALMASLLLAILALVRSSQGQDGMIYLALVCLFGVFASVQFLRGKSAKLLMVALMLGVAIDVIALIGLPVYHALNEVNAPAVGIPAAPDDDSDVEKIRPIDERVDLERVKYGIIILLAQAGVFVYLTTAGIRKHFERPRLPWMPPV
jgi:hypothetical protein